MRAAQESKEEIYLISLDTFMLMAVMGITIGVLFVIVNPMVKPIRDIIEKPLVLEISKQEYERILTEEKVPNSKGQSDTYRVLKPNMLVYGHQQGSRSSELEVYFTNSKSPDIYDLSFYFVPPGDLGYEYKESPSTKTDTLHNEKIISFIKLFPVLSEQTILRK